MMGVFVYFDSFRIYTQNMGFWNGYRDADGWTSMNNLRNQEEALEKKKKVEWMDVEFLEIWNDVLEA